MIEVTELENGIRVVTEQMPHLRTAAFGVFVNVGSANETKENNGIAHVVEHALFKGTKTRTAKQLADEISAIGDVVNAFTAKENTAFYGVTLTEFLPKLMELLSDMLLNSTFEEEPLKKELGVILEEIDMYEDSPEDLVHELLQKNVWKDHPLGFLISGEKSVVRNMTKARLTEFMEQYYCGSNMVISVAGNFDKEVLASDLNRYFGSIPKHGRGGTAGKVRAKLIAGQQIRQKGQENLEGQGQQAWRKVQEDSEGQGQQAQQKYQEDSEGQGQQIRQKVQEDSEDQGQQIRQKSQEDSEGQRQQAQQKYQEDSEDRGYPAVSESPYGYQYAKSMITSESVPVFHRCFCEKKKDVEQLYMNLVFPAVPKTDERRHVLMVVNELLGGSNNSRLFQQIREESGLAYSVYSYSSLYRQAGLFHIDVTVNPANAVTVYEKLAEILTEFAENPVGEEAIAALFTQVRTGLIMGSESARNRMESNAKSLLSHGRVISLEETLEKISKVTAEQAADFARKYLRMEDCSICLVGNLKPAAKKLKECWQG